MAKRKPGRPKGSKNRKATKKTAGRGRPPGSKNKAAKRKTRKKAAGRAPAIRRPRNTGTLTLEAKIKAFTRAPKLIGQLQSDIQTENDLHDAKIEKLNKAHDAKIEKLRQSEKEAQANRKSLAAELKMILNDKPVTAKAATKPSVEKTSSRGRSAGSGDTLKSRLQRLIKPYGQRMEMTEIRRLLKEDGYVSKSGDPTANIYQALRDSSGFERVDKGVFMQHPSSDSVDEAEPTVEIEDPEGDEEGILKAGVDVDAGEGDLDDEEDIKVEVEEDDLVSEVSGELDDED